MFKSQIQSCLLICKRAITGNMYTVDIVFVTTYTTPIISGVLELMAQIAVKCGKI